MRNGIILAYFSLKSTVFKGVWRKIKCLRTSVGFRGVPWASVGFRGPWNPRFIKIFDHNDSPQSILTDEIR